MFLSGDSLQKRLDTLIDVGYGEEVKVDCAALTLTVGDEVFVTPNNDEGSRVKKKLDEKNSQFVIPQGQFALITTKEVVKVPPELIAFISFKATYKFKGLINVSGFHVDPGWEGQLTFSVFNAGPTSIVLERGNPFALIWYAQLDMPSSNDYKKNMHSPEMGLKSMRVSDMAGEVYSPFKLKSDLDELKKEVLTLEGKIINRYAAVLFAIFSGFLIYLFREELQAILR